MSTSNRLVSIACLIGQPLLLNAISIPALAYIIRQLGPLGYGQWMVAASLLALTSFMANLGLRTLFVRAIAQHPEGAEEALAEQMGLRLLLSLLAGCVGIALCWGLGYSRIVCQCAVLAAIALVFTTLACTLADVLQGLQRFKVYSSVNFVSGLLLTAASVIVIRCGAGPVGLSAAYLVGPMVNFVLFLCMVSRYLFPVRIRWNGPRYRALLHNVRMLGMQQLLSALQERVEQLLIPQLVGISAFGYFAAGSMPASRLTVFPDGLATAFYPKIARSHAEENQSHFSDVSRLLTLSLMVCLPLAVLVTFLAGPIAQVLFPKNPALCRQIIQITIWSLPLLGMSMSMGYALQAVGKHAEAARANMVAMVCNVALSLVLIRHFGIVGACWAWIYRPLISIACLLPRFTNTFPAVLLYVPLARLLCCALLMSAICMLTAELRSPTLGVTAIFGAAALVGYGAALFLFRVIHARELKRLFA